MNADLDVGLLVLRLSCGVILAPHGLQKLFGWFDGPGLDRTEAYFAGLGLRPPRAHAVLGGLCEFGGGLLLVLGLCTPLGSAVVIGTLMVAVGTVAGKRGWFANTGGAEFPLTLCLAAWASAFTGPGRYSLDHLIGLDLAGIAAGLAALGLAAAAALVTLATRRPPAATDEQTRSTT
ncbi:DoxX family protein [Streptomyces sp. NPDC048278]|uniref:DoxX family protein n=1 Tax=Streptomyces sp. NPDC048278 TaxID=3155809 RepID=UPI00342DB3EC